MLSCTKSVKATPSPQRSGHPSCFHMFFLQTNCIRFMTEAPSALLAYSLSCWHDCKVWPQA